MTKEKIKGAAAEAIQTKGPQKEEKEKIKGAGAYSRLLRSMAPQRRGQGENKGSGRRGYTAQGPAEG